VSDLIVRTWRRIDEEPGLEHFRLRRARGGIEVESTLIGTGQRSFSMQYAWSLDVQWRSRKLHLRVFAAEEHSVVIERAGTASWRVDGKARTEFDGCDELDVSATPFCNALAIRGAGRRSSRELTALYVAVPELKLTPSRQRYERLGPARWRYVDLGVARGFTAVLQLDRAGLVRKYQHLFEQVGGDPPRAANRKPARRRG
jgi:hypothetical protein